MTQGFHNLRVIVHTPEKHGLVVHRHTASEQSFARACRRLGDLPGMVELCDEPDRPVLIQNPAQACGYALGQHNRDPRADADDFDVRYPAEATQNFIQPGIRQGQGIPSGNQHVADLLVGGKIGKYLFPSAGILFKRIMFPEPFSKAVPAKDRAAGGCQQHDPVRVAVDESWGNRVRLLS